MRTRRTTGGLAALMSIWTMANGALAQGGPVAAPAVSPVADPEAAARMAPADEAPPPMPEWLTLVPGGLTAERAARMAVDTAPGVRGREAAGVQARARADQALSGFAPQVTITGSYTRINQVDLPPFEIIPGMPIDNPFPQILDLWALQGQVQVPVSDYFFAIWPSYEGADGYARAAELQIEVERQQAAFRARESFYNHVRALAAHWVAEQSVLSLEATLSDVESSQSAGVGSRADVAQVRGQLASARAFVVQVNGLVRVTERMLRRQLHLPAQEPVRIGEDLFTTAIEATPEESGVVARALAERAEVRALRTVVEAREALARAQVGSVLPHLALTGQVTTSTPNQRVVPQTTDIYTTWAVGAAISWSPNELAVGIHRIREAEAAVSAAREDLAQLEDGVVIEAAQAVAAHQTAAESIAAARENVASAEISLSDREALLRAGMATTTEVTLAQLELTRARLSLLDATVDLHVARAQIERIVGDAAPED